MLNAVDMQMLTGPRPKGAALSTHPATARAQFSFLTELGRKLNPQNPQMAKQAATQLLAQLFFVPLLAEMREFQFGRALATGGQMESAFGQRLDERIADTVAARSPGLVAQIEKYFAKLLPANTAAANPQERRPESTGEVTRA